MIVTSLIESAKYGSLHPLFAKAFQYLREVNVSTLELGRQEIDGEKLFAIISEYQGKPIEEARPEAHRTYIDIQYVLEGEEHILWMPLEEASEIDVDYDDSSDIMFFKDRPQCDITLKPTQMAILFPEDIHAPAISRGKVRKIILKILV